MNKSTSIYSMQSISSTDNKYYFAIQIVKQFTFTSIGNYVSEKNNLNNLFSAKFKPILDSLDVMNVDLNKVINLIDDIYNKSDKSYNITIDFNLPITQGIDPYNSAIIIGWNEYSNYFPIKRIDLTKNDSI